MSSQNRAKAGEAFLRKHPLQRLHSPARGVSGVIHALGLTSFALSFKYLVDHPNEINDSYGWHLQYLTIIGLAIASVTFAAGLLADIFASPQIFFVKNALSVTGAPMEVLISMLYWGLGMIDPHLVTSPWLPPLPLYADLGFHLAPALFLVVDLLLLSPPWTITSLPALAISSGIAVSYWFWVEACYAQNGFYPYPIFSIAKHWRIALFVMAANVMMLNTLCLKWLHRALNGREALYGSRPGKFKKYN